MVAFVFLSQNFGRWHAIFCHSRTTGWLVGTLKPYLLSSKTNWTFCTHRWQGYKTSLMSLHPLAPELKLKLSLPNFVLFWWNIMYSDILYAPLAMWVNRIAVSIGWKEMNVIRLLLCSFWLLVFTHVCCVRVWLRANKTLPDFTLKE